MAEFGRHGYSGGSLNVIAREAGVGQGLAVPVLRRQVRLLRPRRRADLAAHLRRARALPRQDRPSRSASTCTGSSTSGSPTWPRIRSSAGSPRRRRWSSTRRSARAVRAPVHRLYAQGIRPLLVGAVDAGELRRRHRRRRAARRCSSCCCRTWRWRRSSPAWTPALALHGVAPRTRTRHAHRLVDTLLERSAGMTARPLRRPDHRLGLRRQRERAAADREGLPGRRARGRPPLRRPRVAEDVVAGARLPVRARPPAATGSSG